MQSVMQSEVDGMLDQSVEKGGEEGEWRGECSWDGAGEQLNYLSLNSFVYVNSFANTTNPSILLNEIQRFESVK